MFVLKGSYNHFVGMDIRQKLKWCLKIYTEWSFHKTAEFCLHLEVFKPEVGVLSEECSTEGIYTLEQELRVMSSGLSFGEGPVGKTNSFLLAVGIKEALDFLSCILKYVCKQKYVWMCARK